MKAILTFARKEIQSQIPYALICETMEGSRWNTGKRRRLMSEQFTESEIKKSYELRKKAYSWHLVKGVPEKVRMSPNTFYMWHKLGDFCAQL